MSPTGPRPYLPPRVGLIPPHGFSGGNSSSTSHDNSLSQGGGQQQGEAGGGIGGGGEQGNAGGPGVALLRGGLHRPPGDSIHNNNPIARPSGSAGPGSGPDGLHQQQQYRGALGPPGPMMMDSAPLPGMMREGEGVGVVRGGAAMIGEAVAQAAQPAMADRESGQGMVEIPDAIPAELNYEVSFA